MPRKRRLAEKDRYPIIETYIRKRFNCFETVQNKGTKFGRVDVVGLRDIGGDLSGALEVVAVEVKNGNQPFNTAVGQAYSYSVYAERCYLADARDECATVLATRDRYCFQVGRRAVGYPIQW